MLYWNLVLYVLVLGGVDGIDDSFSSDVVVVWMLSVSVLPLMILCLVFCGQDI